MRAIGRGRRLQFGLVMIAWELLALGLLWLRVGTSLSLGLPLAFAWLFLNRRLVARGMRRLLHVARRTMKALRKLGDVIKVKALSRQTWRLRVSTLLLTVFLIALPCAWFSHRFHRVERERNALNGTWCMLDWNTGLPVRVRGKLLTVELRPGTYEIDPTRRPRWIDFRIRGTSRFSKAIYDWDGGRLRVCQDSGGTGHRPATFDTTIGGRFVLERQ